MLKIPAQAPEVGHLGFKLQMTLTLKDVGVLRDDASHRLWHSPKHASKSSNGPDGQASMQAENEPPGQSEGEGEGTGVGAGGVGTGGVGAGAGCQHNSQPKPSPARH